MRLRSLTRPMLLALALAACGQKGSLYLPDEPREPVPPAAAADADADAADEDDADGD